MKTISLKEWRFEEAKRLGISSSAVNARLYHAKARFYPRLRFKRVNKRTVFVVVP